MSNWWMCEATQLCSALLRAVTWVPSGTFCRRGVTPWLKTTLGSRFCTAPVRGAVWKSSIICSPWGLTPVTGLFRAGTACTMLPLVRHHTSTCRQTSLCTSKQQPCFCQDTLCLFAMRHTQEHVVACHAYLMPRCTCNFLNTDACSSVLFQAHNRCDQIEPVCQAPQTGVQAASTHCLPIQQIQYHVSSLTPCACGTGGACAAIDYLVTPDSEQGCSLDVTDNDGNTAWHVAAEGGHLEAVQCLLKEGASMESTNAAGCTALHVAARCGQNQPPTCSPHRASTCPVHTFVQ